MCGIAGYLQPGGLNGLDAAEVLEGMTQVIRHRGPDDSGRWIDADSGIALGHRRLSILDLSPRGHQPMISGSGRYVISYNGEIYNFRALQRELAAHGYRFHGHSDTEVLLGAVDVWGLEAALRRCHGMFAFAIWDRERRELHLARDRAGEKPLYYGWHGGSLLFASELKALRVHPAFQADVDRDALTLFLRHGYFPAPTTVYRATHKLPPGSLLTVPASAPGSRPSPVAYWSAREVAERGVREPFRGSAEEAVQRLDELLRDAVRLQMEADVPLGAFLSGGIDSTTIVALMQAQSTRPVKTFTIGFHEDGYNEAEHAKAVAQHLGTEHTELYVQPREARDVIPRLPALYDEPFADPSQIPTYLVAELARRHVTVSLSGDAGDELFGGYPRYFTGQDVWRRIGWLPAPLRQMAASLLRAPSPALWNAFARVAGQRMARRLGNGTLEQRTRQVAGVLAAADANAMYLRMMSYWKEPTAVVRGAREPVIPLAAEAAGVEIPDLFQRMMYADTVTYLPDDILVKVDRASMGVSLEARVPLLDPRVIEFAWQLPHSLKVRDGKGKWILREVLYRYVPQELMERPKMGFGVPIAQWLRGPLREWAEELLDRSRLHREGIFVAEGIRAKWSEHLSGRANWEYLLWSVLMFQAWLEANGPVQQARRAASPPAVLLHG